MFSRFLSFSASDSASFLTGIDVHCEITSQISSSPTTGVFFSESALRSLFFSSKSCLAFASSSRSDAAFSKFCSFIASCFSLVILTRLSSSALISGVEPYETILILDAASSIKSIALSGRYLSVIYLAESFAAAVSASSRILTL